MRMQSRSSGMLLIHVRVTHSQLGLFYSPNRKRCRFSKNSHECGEFTMRPPESGAAVLQNIPVCSEFLL